MAVNRFLRELEGLFNYSTDENPTTQQDYQEAVKNWVQTIESIVDCTLWQPETTYQVGDTVRTPSLSKQALLLCITEGQSGAAEPDYTDVSSNDEIIDGTVVWKVQTVTSQEKEKEYIDEQIEYIDEQISAAVPTGCVQAFAGNSLPDGWLLCDGSAVSRTTYANLFSCIGTTYGAGDGSSTFNLPNLVDKFIEGSATAGTEKSAGLPNIAGSFDGRNRLFIVGGATGALYVNVQDDFLYGYGSSQPSSSGTLNIDASRSSSIYGNSTTVQPPALTMKYIIKY